jgi:hypothetical protein
MHGTHSVSKHTRARGSLGGLAAVQINKSFGECDVDALGRDVDTHAKRSGQWDEYFAARSFNAQKRRPSRELHVQDDAEARRSAHFPNLAANQVAYIIASRVELGALVQRDLNFQAAKLFGGFNVVYAGEKKNGLAASAGGEPAALHASTARLGAAIGQPHLAQLRKPLRKIRKDLRGDFATQPARPQNSSQGNADE